jgi:hypothetical protein
MKPPTANPIAAAIGPIMERMAARALRGKVLVADTAPAADPRPRLPREAFTKEPPESLRSAFWRRLRTMSPLELRTAHDQLLQTVLQEIPLELQRVERNMSLTQPQYSAARAEIFRLQDDVTTMLDDCKREIERRRQQHELRRLELYDVGPLDPEEVLNLAEYPQLARFFEE